MFDEDLKHFQLIGIKPDLVAREAFIHGDDIVIAVGSEEHSVPAIRTVDLRRFVQIQFSRLIGIQHKVFLESPGFLDE